MSDTVAIVGVVSSSSVAIAVAVIGASQERHRLRWQERGARAHELRNILDAGAVALTDAWDKLGQRKVASDEKLDATGQAFSDAVTAVQRATTRIVLRLGAESETAAGYRDAYLVLDELRGVIWRAQEPRVDKWDDRRKKRLEDLEEKLHAAEHTFHDQALRYVGTRPA